MAIAGRPMGQAGSSVRAKLLALETRLIGDEMAAADPLYVEDHLRGAASLAAATDGSARLRITHLGGRPLLALSAAPPSTTCSPVSFLNSPVTRRPTT